MVRPHARQTKTHAACPWQLAVAGLAAATMGAWGSGGCTLDTSPILPLEQADSSLGGGGRDGRAGAGGTTGTPPISGIPAPGPTRPGDGKPLVGCDARGIYGLVSDVDVYWGGRSEGLAALTDSGRGRIRIKLKLEVSAVDADTGMFSGTASVCGAELPSFTSSTLCEAYQPIFPPRVWDAPQMPKQPFQGELVCAGNECTMQLFPVTALLGIELGYANGPWPAADDTRTLRCASGRGSQCFPDHDGDKHPGIGVELETSRQSPGTCQRFGTLPPEPFTFRAAPLSSDPWAIFDGVHRTDRLHLGLRTRLGVTLQFDDACLQGRGMSDARYLESRAWGCLVQEGSVDVATLRPAAGPNQACTNEQATFIDQNLPIYFALDDGQQPPTGLGIADRSPSAGATASAIRLGALGATVSCADVRDAAYGR